MLQIAVFELVQQFYHATDIGNVANAINALRSALALISHIADNIKTFVSVKVNYRRTHS